MTKLAKIKHRQDGEWFCVSKAGHRLICCDCGLEHLVKYKITKGRLYIQAFRLNHKRPSKT